MAEINLSLKFCPTNCPTKYLSIFKNVAEEKDENYFLLSKYVYSQNRYAWKQSATAEMEEDLLRKHLNLKKLVVTVCEKLTKMPMS